MSFLKGPKAGMHMFFDSWPDAHVLDGGLFGEYAYQIFPRFRLVVGTRVDFVDTGANPDEKARMGFNRFYGPGASDFSEFEVNVSANGPFRNRQFVTDLHVSISLEFQLNNLLHLRFEVAQQLVELVWFVETV